MPRTYVIDLGIGIMFYGIVNIIFYIKICINREYLPILHLKYMVISLPYGITGTPR